MKRAKRGSWWGLYALIPVTVVLLYLAHEARVGQTLHTVLLLAIVICVAIFALLWSEKHADLMGSEGVDARAEADWLTAAGTTAGRLAPSLTARQAHYRTITLAKLETDAKRATSSNHSM